MLHSDVWRLPGPGGYVREIARRANGGQHVLAVLPRFISDDPAYSDALAVATLNELVESGQRIYPTSSQGPLVAALGFNMTGDFDDSPVTVPDLLTHRDVVGRVFVCNAADLEHSHRMELSAFLERLDLESRLGRASERATMVFLVGRDLIPGDPASVATVRLWYWDRVARWDVAALLNAQDFGSCGGDVLDEVRMEAISEIARWDLEFAVALAHDWSGGELEIAQILRNRNLPSPPNTPIRRTTLQRPPEALLEPWDQGVFEAWHGAPNFAPACITDALGDGLGRLLWSAQARVLMPWLEVRRVRVEEIVREKLGPARMNSSADEFRTRFPGVEVDVTIIELGTLTRIINARLGRTDFRLRTTTQTLLSARNRLAHLKPLTDDELRELVQVCAWLD